MYLYKSRQTTGTLHYKNDLQINLCLEKLREVNYKTAETPFRLIASKGMKSKTINSEANNPQVTCFHLSVGRDSRCIDLKRLFWLLGWQERCCELQSTHRERLPRSVFILWIAEWILDSQELGRVWVSWQMQTRPQRGKKLDPAMWMSWTGKQLLGFWCYVKQFKEPSDHIAP